MFVENDFPGDPRVRIEADTLTAAGYSVHGCGTSGKGSELRNSIVDNIQVYSVPQVSLFNSNF